MEPEVNVPVIVAVPLTENACVAVPPDCPTAPNVQVTVVGPRPKLLPLNGEQVTVALPQLSVAVTG